MRVFVTGATGFIGSAVVPELIKHGHEVVGLARSDKAAAEVEAMGAVAHRGNVEDLESLRSGAEAADGVIHLGFIHDFARFLEVCEIDRKAIEAMGDALAGSDRPFVVTGGMSARTPGRASTELDPPNSHFPRVVSETATEAAVAKGVRGIVVRLPQVHDPYKQGLISPLVEITRAKGESAYVGDGSNCWPAVHVSDAAVLYRLALEKGEAGKRYHCVGEEGVSQKAIAEVIGRVLGLPVVSKVTEEEVQAHFGWLSVFAGQDMSGSSALTREWLGWEPVGPGLIADLGEGKF